MSTWTTPFWFPIHHHTAHLCQLGEALCNLIGDLSEQDFEDKLGVIPNDGLTVRQRNLDLHIDLRTIVQAQPAVRNHTIRDHFETHLLAARRDLIATSHFPVQDQLKFLLLGLDLQGLESPKKGPNLQEVENQTSADHQLNHLLKHVLYDWDIRAHLGVTHDSRHPPLRLTFNTLQTVELRLQQEARHAWLQELCHTLRQGVSTMRCTEGVVHDKVHQAGHALRQLRVILHLALVEANVLQDHHVALHHGARQWL
eukprot:CAMPEP_0115414458 /NCGR_PEP_ID=MMETSP0271-20121206/22592_1 /TAXON_ID=71861 /ORGANISM="Scrippsiella trochoidea, Strain CCMP3099" /LENGTH=254 /DNA_ID=CAMNT_0002838761 /DNA_START=2031 /DNA_END=2793 /DNA_ORIENTATION=+